MRKRIAYFFCLFPSAILPVANAAIITVTTTNNLTPLPGETSLAQAITRPQNFPDSRRTVAIIPRDESMDF